jgi:hypothetical protein
MIPAGENVKRLGPKTSDSVGRFRNNCRAAFGFTGSPACPHGCGSAAFRPHLAVGLAFSLIGGNSFLSVYKFHKKSRVATSERQLGYPPGRTRGFPSPFYNGFGFFNTRLFTIALCVPNRSNLSDEMRLNLPTARMIGVKKVAFFCIDTGC